MSKVNLWGGRVIAIFKNHKIWLHGLCRLVIFMAGWYLASVTKVVSRQFITSDERFATNLDQAIKDLLDQNMHQTGQQRFNELKNIFPVVSALKIKRIGLNKNHIQVVSSNPIYRLGSRFVLTSSNDVLLAHDFSHAALRNLPVIFLHTSPELVTDIEPEQKSFLQHLPDFVLSEYEIHWYHLNHIMLINKQDQKQRILIKHNQSLTPELLVTCEHLRTEYQVHANKKCLETIQIDLRFDRQVIVSC